MVRLEVRTRLRRFREKTLGIYPENRPSELNIEFGDDRIPLNYGPDAYIPS